MNKETFRFFLKNEGGSYYYVSGGAVLLSNRPKVLGEVIASWRDFEASLMRVENNWGVVREVGLDLKFVRDGKKIVDHVIFQNGLASFLKFEVQKLNTGTGQYSLWLECEVDTTTFIREEDMTTVHIKEGGMMGILRSRNAIEYTVDVGNDAITMEIGGTRLGAMSFWQVGNASKTSTIATFMNNDGGHKSGIIMPPATHSGVNVQAGDFIRPYNQGRGNLGEYYGGSEDQLNAGNARAYAEPNRTFKLVPLARPFAPWYNVSISGDMSMQVNLCIGESGYIGSVSVFLRRFNLDTGAQPQTLIGFKDGIPTNSKEDIQFPLFGFIPAVETNELLYLVIKTDSNFNLGSSQKFDEMKIWVDESKLQINYLASVPSTLVKGYRYFEFINKFLAKMTDNQYTAVSSFLSNNMNSTVRAANFDSKPRNVIVCSGDTLRGLSGSKYTTTWNNILQDLWSMYGIVPTYQGNVVRLEPLKTALNDQVIFSAKTINNLSLSFLQEKNFNQVNVGQSQNDNENVEGRNEYNAQISFVVEANKQTQGVLDFVSPFRKDIYGIEAARAEGLDMDRKDVRFDKDIFLVEVSDGTNANGYYYPYRVTGHISGVDDPIGVYNISLSPARCLRRNLSFVRSFYSQGILRYTSTKKNPDLEANIRMPYNPAGMIKEIDNINLLNNVINGNNVDPIFLPIQAEFETTSDYNLVELTQNNLNGLIEFLHNGNRFYGWILEVGVYPGTRDKYNFRILLHKNTNLSLL